MRILVSLSQFVLGGTATYSVTVAEQLERLGHPTTLHAPSANDAGRELAASRGLRLAVGEPAVALADPGGFDAAIVQDAACAYAFADLRPDLRQIFVIHGLAAFEQPPRALRPVPAAVVLNDRIGGRAAALACRPEVARLRQPIDLEAFRPRGTSRPRARRVLALGNYLEGNRLRLLEGVCGELGLELSQVGAPGTPNAAPQDAIADADIVVGYGRAVLEGMAMGRAAYVWDRAGGDGWVTPESYPALEADGFSGAATDAVVDAARLRSDFGAYRPELGTLGYDLVRQHHSAAKHAEALVGLLEGAEATVPDEALESLSLLVRAETRATIRAGGLEYANRRIWERLNEVEAESRAAVEGQAAAEQEIAARQNAVETMMRSRSWRLTAPLRWAGSRLRGPGRRDS